ncbi:MAG: 4-phytase [Chloroflexi bacterium]|nr:4-phytase [Anaerolineae bacterium]MCC6565449.1 4-phytase [Chloroflexota bacterium]
MKDRNSRTAPRMIAVMLIAFALLSLIALPARAQSGALTIATNAPVNLEPALGSNDPELLFNRAIYDYLLDVTPDNAIAPNLATSYTISDDGLVYTFELAQGVTFHDGAAFTSSDVVYTFERLKTLESPALGLLSGGAFTVEAVDDDTVTFTLESPNADFLYGIGGRLAYILSEDIATPNVLAEGDHPYANFAGTGPFVLTEFLPGERAVFTANVDYFKPESVQLATITHVYIEDPLAQIQALTSGAADFIFKIPVTQLPALEGVDGITVLNKATNIHPVIRIRTAEGFRGEDPRIRQALKLGVNREELNELAIDGLGVVGNNDPIGPIYGDFYERIPDTYDPAAACALILEATGEERISFDFYAVDALGYPDLAVIMQQQWQDACIDVELLVRPEGVYYGDNEWLDVELGLTGWSSRAIPQQYLVEAYITGAPYNESNFSDAELDALAAQAAATTDPAARATIYKQIAHIFADRGPIIVPYFAPVLGAITNRVQGLDMNPVPGLTDLRGVSVSD